MTCFSIIIRATNFKCTPWCTSWKGHSSDWLDCVIMWLIIGYLGQIPAEDISFLIRRFIPQNIMWRSSATVLYLALCTLLLSRVLKLVKHDVQSFDLSWSPSLMPLFWPLWLIPLKWDETVAGGLVYPSLLILCSLF